MNRQITRRTNLISLVFGLLVCFLNLDLVYAQNNVDSTFSESKFNTRVHNSGVNPSAQEVFNDIFRPLLSEVYYNLFPPSVGEMYNSAVAYINKGEIETAKKELSQALYEIDYGKCKECSDEHTTRLIEYKSHVILANIAFAEKSMWDLDREVSFFKNADTSQIEWERARYAARHFKHKYCQLMNGNYGKAVGDWVSAYYNSEGVPMVWIRIYLSNDTLFAELKDCAMKSMLSAKYSYYSDKIVLDNVNNVIEVNFGDSKLMPGLQFLPSIAISTINDVSKMFSESIAAKSIIKYGTPYVAETVFKQLGLDAVTLLAGALIAQLSVTKETITCESFVMEEISPEVYMAKIQLRNYTAYSDGRHNDEFEWAEVPVFHLYPNEELDFSKGHIRSSLKKAVDLLNEELFWEGLEETDELSKRILEDVAYSTIGMCSVENTTFDHPFYFLGKDINHKTNSNSSATFFTGLAQADHLWGYKEEPINPMNNRSEMNTRIIPIRGVFKTIISPTECITFTGDWNDSEKCGNGLLSYVNTDFPEYSFTYEGTIKKGFPHGIGIWQSLGFRYVGWFYEGEKFGYGTVSYDGKDTQGFAISGGYMVSDNTVTKEMKEDFNDKVNKISKHKYQILND